MLRKLPIPVRIIAAILLTTFLAQDIVWSYPETSVNNKLAVTGLQNPETLHRLKTAMSRAKDPQTADRHDITPPHSADERADSKSSYRVESVYKDYFETILEFNVRLFVLLAKRVKARRISDEAASEKAKSDIQECVGQLLQEMAKFEARLKDLRPDMRMVERHSKAKAQFIKADEFIRQDDEPAANAALVDALNIVSGTREEILRKRVARTGYNVRVFEEDHKIVMLQQVYTRQDKESKTLVPAYIKKTFGLYWLAGNSLDRQEDGNLDERDTIKDYVNRVEKDQITAETNPSALTTVNVDQILLGLSGAQVEEKRSTRIVLEAVKELIEMGEPGSVKHLLPIAKDYLELRIEDIDNILYYLNTARVKPFRTLVTKRNESFISRTKNIRSMIDRGKYDIAIGSAYGLLKVLKPYLAEPDLEGLEDMLWPVINELNNSQHEKPAVTTVKAKLWLKLVTNKLEDSQSLNEFMELFSTEYSRRRRDSSPLSSKEDTFIDAFEKFVERKHLTRGSPRTRALQILSYLAVFVSLEINNPEKPSERIPNSVFKAINALRLLVEVDNIKTIANIKRLKELESTINILNGFKTRKFIHELAYEERKQLIGAIAKDFGLGDKERFELAKAFAISRKNLHKTYASFRDKSLSPDIAKEDPSSAEVLARRIERVINTNSTVKGKDNREYMLKPAITGTERGWALEAFIYSKEAVSEKEILGNIRLTVIDGVTVRIDNAEIRDKAARGQGIFTHILKAISEASDERLTLVLYKIEQLETLIEANKLLAPKYLNAAATLILEKADKKGYEAATGYEKFLHDNLAQAMLRGAKIDPNALGSTPMIRALREAGYGEVRFVVEKDETGAESGHVVNIRAVKSDRQKGSGSELTVAARSLGQVIANAISPAKDIAPEIITGKAIILYADDILDRGAAGDLAYTLSNSQVLDNSTIVIYGRNPGRAQLLEKIISEAAGDKNISIIKIEPEDLRGYNGYEQINTAFPNEAKELGLVLSRLAAHHKINNGNILGAIKGMTSEAFIKDIKDFSLERHLPIVSFEDDKGIYSFKNALAALIAITKDDTPPANREWYRTLRPIEKEDIERAYQDYRRALEVAINA